MSKNHDEYCYSWNSVDYKGSTFNTLKAALADAAAENDEKNTHVYVGKVERPSNSRFFPNAGDVIEHMEEQAYDYGGEFAENYLDVSDEAKTELNYQLEALLEAWCQKHGVSPTFYQVGNVKEYPVPVMAK